MSAPLKTCPLLAQLCPRCSSRSVKLWLLSCGNLNLLSIHHSIESQSGNYREDTWPPGCARYLNHSEDIMQIRHKMSVLAGDEISFHFIFAWSVTAEHVWGELRRARLPQTEDGGSCRANETTRSAKQEVYRDQSSIFINLYPPN